MGRVTGGPAGWAAFGGMGMGPGGTHRCLQPISAPRLPARPPLTPCSDWFASSFTGCLKVSTYFIDCEKTYTLGNDTVNW